jgi:hypothetical protein
MNMVILSSEFYERAIPFLAELLTCFFEEGQDLRVEALASIFGH